MANPVVTFEMANGDVIKAELYPEIAPNTVNNFVSLVNKGFYDGLIFHRVISGFMIQGGCPDGTGMGGPGYSINLESACQLAAEGYGIAFNFYQYMKNFHYPKPVRCFRIGNPDDTTSYSIITLKGKQTLRRWRS